MTGSERLPLTEFICALVRMTPEQRQAASADKASARYGLPLQQCRWWIEHFRTVFEKQSRRRK